MKATSSHCAKVSIEGHSYKVASLLRISPQAVIKRAKTRKWKFVNPYPDQVRRRDSMLPGYAVSGEARAHPLLMNRGYEKNPIPDTEFYEIIVPEVIAWHNSRPGRRGGICNGRSFDQVFAEGIQNITLRQASPQLPRLVLYTQESCKASAQGTVTLKSGKGYGRHRYYGEALIPYEGENVAVFFDPDNLSGQVAVHDLEGRFIGHANWLQTVAFNDTKAARETCEAICSVAITTGKISWPIFDGGRQKETYSVDFGKPLTTTPKRQWDAKEVDMGDIYNTLKNMRQTLRNEGYGGDIEIWAGTDAFEALIKKAQIYPEKAALSVEVTEKGINIAGYLIKERNEIYRDPTTKSIMPIMPVDSVLMVALDAGHNQSAKQ